MSDTPNIANVELQNLAKAANDAYLAFFAATLHAPKTPEFERLREINNALREAVVHAKNHLDTTTR